MVRQDIVQQKLSELAVRVARVRMHAAPGAEALASDPDALDLVAFNLMLAVQAATDIAAHIVADEGWPPPASTAAGFDTLASHSVVSTDTAKAMRRATRFRNVVAHGYAGIDVAAAYTASTHGLEDLDRFAREVAAWLVRRGVEPPA